MDYFENGFSKVDNILDNEELKEIMDDMILLTKNYCEYYNIKYDVNLSSEELLYNMLNNIYKINSDLYWNFTRQNGIFSDLYSVKKLITNKNIIKILKNININNFSVPVSPQINLYCDFMPNL